MPSVKYLPSLYSALGEAVFDDASEPREGPKGTAASTSQPHSQQGRVSSPTIVRPDLNDSRLAQSSRSSATLYESTRLLGLPQQDGDIGEPEEVEMDDLNKISGMSLNFHERLSGSKWFIGAYIKLLKCIDSMPA
ncbi:hypothetical protein ACEPAG_844 [Sanghuangporus baumii]